MMVCQPTFTVSLAVFYFNHIPIEVTLGMIFFLIKSREDFLIFSKEVGPSMKMNDSLSHTNFSEDTSKKQITSRKR